MMRKPGKMPNTLSSKAYATEYGMRAGLTVQRNKIQPHHRVLIIDDLVATGGTLGAAMSLAIHALNATVVECACIVELRMFVDPPADSPLPNRTNLYKELKVDHVPIWALMSEEILTTAGELPEDYVDDGEEH
jgi:orotate phosphoribosyltransferase